MQDTPPISETPLISETSLAKLEPSSILIQILKEARDLQAEGRRMLTVFDLDSTLFDLTLRISIILDSFAKNPEMLERYPSEIAQMKNTQVLPTDWDIQESLDRVGLMRDEYASFSEAIHQHWAHYFFSDSHLEHDVPLPGAVRFVLTLRGFGADVMYLTAREEERMINGTRLSLAQHGFPVSDTNSRLVLKPRTAKDDAQFKVDVLKKEVDAYARIWFFENEPVNLNLTAKQLPQVGLVFLDTTHSRKEEVDETLARIPHFDVELADLLSLG